MPKRMLRNSKTVTVGLMSLLTVLTVLQIHNLYTKEDPEIPQLSFASDGSKSDNNAYYESEDFKLVKVKPGDDSSHAALLDGEVNQTSDTHQVNDYSDEEYYTNKEYADYSNTEAIDEALEETVVFKKFINDKLFKAISNSNPSIGPVNNEKHYNDSNTYMTSWDKKMPVLNGKIRENNGVDPIRSKRYLESYFLLSDDEKKSLKESHAKFLKEMPEDFPEEISQNIKGKGILYAGGGTYNWLVLLSLKMLRDTGSRLPVEVFIPTEAEYSPDLCDRVFPILGAKCILMSNYVDSAEVKLKGYQLKSMALLLTSFEDVLMLDSDNIPLKNPDTLFINEPYTNHGMVVWPDFWRRSTSPSFYDIAQIPVNETNQIRNSYGDERDHPKNLNTVEDYNWKISYHDLEGTFPEASAETGQLLINKKTHVKAIFLSLYYNFYGPDYYYPLFSQGQAGEGDKETILAAAHKFNLPYYQVQEYIREFGELTGNYEFHIAAMGQYDPILDYIQSKNPEKYQSGFPYDRTKNNYLMHKYGKSETFFLHCNQPKLYPWKVDGNGFRMIHNGDGNRRRLYSKVLLQEIGYDIEAKIWETMSWIVCKHGDMNIKGMRDPEKWCGRVNEQLEFLKKDQLNEGETGSIAK